MLAIAGAVLFIRGRANADEDWYEEPANMIASQDRMFDSGPADHPHHAWNHAGWLRSHPVSRRKWFVVLSRPSHWQVDGMGLSKISYKLRVSLQDTRCADMQ